MVLELQHFGRAHIEPDQDCILFEQPHTGVGEEHEDEETSETNCYELTATPIPHPPTLLRRRSKEYERKKVLVCV